MVVKLIIFFNYDNPKFESSVISYGSEASVDRIRSAVGFESSVISYGSEAQSMTCVSR